MAQDLKEFEKELAEKNLGPLWSTIHLLVTKEPVVKPVPYLWKKELIYHYLEKAEGLLEVGKDAERRAVYLINPGMKDLQPYGWGGATHTLYAAIQAVKPGEIAPSHRHRACALRFVMEGRGAWGAVEGQRITFEPGDYLITPDWLWHDHANTGNETVVWMDGLDIPFVLYMNASFYEAHKQAQQPVHLPDDYGSRRYQGGMVRPIDDRKSNIAPVGRYKWDLTVKAIEGLAEFDPDPYDGYAVEYFNPSNGKDADLRIGAWMQKLPPNFKGKAHRHVHSQVYHVYRGEGYTVMNGVRFDWKAGDFFALPAWTWHEHVNTSSHEDAYLFSINDLPLLEAFDMERQEEYKENGGHQPVREVFQPLMP